MPAGQATPLFSSTKVLIRHGCALLSTARASVDIPLEKNAFFVIYQLIISF